FTNSSLSQSWTNDGVLLESSTRTCSRRKFWRQEILRIHPAIAERYRSIRSFLRRSVFASNKSVAHRRGALFDFVSPGCSSQSRAAQSLPFLRVCSKQPWPAV